MIQDIVIQDFTRDDIEKILPLINAEFVIKKNFDYYNWQCFENPSPHNLKIALINDKVVGWFGIQKRILNNGIKCGQLSYLVIAPKWRGRGIFKKLGISVIESMKDLDLCFVFANNKARIPCEKSFDMQTISSINSYVCTTFDNITPSDFFSKEVDDSTLFKDIDFSLSDRVSFHYSPDFFKWRFAHNRLYNYTMIELYSGEFALVKVFKDLKTGDKIGDIVYYKCDLKDSASIRRLIMSACYFLKCLKVTAITTWAPDHDRLLQILFQIGFANRGSGSYFTIKVLNPDNFDLYDYSRWIIMQSDASNY